MKIRTKEGNQMRIIKEEKLIRTEEKMEHGERLSSK